MEVFLATRIQILYEVVRISNNDGYESILSFTNYGWIIGQTGLFKLGLATRLRKRKLWIQTNLRPGEGWAPLDYISRTLCITSPHLDKTCLWDSWYLWRDHFFAIIVSVLASVRWTFIQIVSVLSQFSTFYIYIGKELRWAVQVLW